MFTNKCAKYRSCQSAAFRDGGFTLIELAIVILISGLLMLPLIQLYSNYIQDKKIIDTTKGIDNVASNLARAFVTNYPCPSDRSLAVTDANYGEDVCQLAGFSIATVPTCNTTGQEQGICKTVGERDVDGVGGNDLVLIGGVPIKIAGTPIAGIKGDDTIDAWGNRLSYAVSYPATTSTSGFTRFKQGDLRIVDEFGNDTAGTNSDALFIVFSHGQDRHGGFSEYDGVRIDCVVANEDGENCDGDGVFTQGLGHYGGTMKFDDLAYVQTDESAGLWLVVSDGSAANLPTSHIQEIPNGAIGVNTDTPGTGAPTGMEVRLDVNGDILADTVRTPTMCDKSGNNCIDLGTNFFFGGRKDSAAGAVRNDCADGEVISSISQQKVSCSKASVQNLGTAVMCPVTTWVAQIYTDGRIKCTNGVVCPGGAGCL